MDSYMLKFLDEERFVKEFRSGQIRMMSAYYYATLEEKGIYYNNRFDSTEGKTFIFNNSDPPKERIIKFGGEMEMKVGESVHNFVFNPLGLNEQIKLSCYTIFEEKDMPDGKFKTALDSMKDSLGEYYILFTNPEEFSNRIEKCFKQLKKDGKVKKLTIDRVRYYDMKATTGLTNPLEKPDGLSWQREARVIIETVNSIDPFYINIGDISGITIWGKVEDLKQGYVNGKMSVWIPGYCI